MIKISSKQTGSAHIVIIIILVIVLMGALGFIFWQNFLSPKDTVSQQETAKNVESSEPKKNLDEGYLILKDWDIKFKLPQTKSEIVYYKEQANGVEYYDFTTKRVEALGETCVEPNDQGFVTRLGSISRSATKNELHPSAYAINNNEPLDGFYYYNSGAQSICAEASIDIQIEDRKLVNDMLMSPMLIE